MRAPRLQQFADIRGQTTNYEFDGFLRRVSHAAKTEFLLSKDPMIHEISTPNLEPFPEFAVQKNDGERAYLLALDESRSFK